MEPEVGAVRIASDGKRYRYLGTVQSQDWKDRANWEVVEDASPRADARMGGGSVGSSLRDAINPRTQADLLKAELSGVVPFSDEMRAVISSIPALFPGGKSFREAFRENAAAESADMDRIRTEHGAGATVAQAIGSLVPAAAPLRLGSALVRGGRGLLATGASGAGVGAVEGGLFGAGEAEPGNRAVGGAVGAGIGAGVGALAGSLPALLNLRGRGASGRGARVANELQNASGLRGDINAAADASEEALEEVRNRFYRPFEQQHTAINHTGLIDQLRSEDVLPHTRSVSKEVAEGTRPPSFKEAQEIWQQLRKAGRNSPAHKRYAENVMAALEDAVPGFKDANRAYADASAPMRAMLDGRSMYNADSADIERAVRGMSRDQRQAFRVGQLHEIVRRLEMRDEAAVGLLRRYMDAGPEPERLLRQLLGDGYDQFRTALNSERSAEAVRTQLTQAAKGAGWATLAAAAGAAGGWAGGLSPLP